MNCTRIQEELVALIQDELDEAQAAEVRAHLEGCPACREELDQLHAALQVSRVVPPIEPSVGFRERLQARLAEARRGAVIQASGRFAARRREPWRFRYFAVAAAMLLLVLGITQFIVVSGPAQDDRKMLLELAQQRWAQRADAPRWQALLKGTDIQLPAEVAAESLLAVAHVDSAFRENCVALFTDRQIEQLQADPRIDRERLGRMLARSVRVTVENGMLRLPGPMALRNLPGGDRGVALLRLNGRFELWSEGALRAYLQERPRLEMVPTETPENDPGLPPEAGTRTDALPAA